MSEYLTQDVPSGFKKVIAYWDGNLLVVLGIPDETHNCDSMGCGSVGGHVVMKINTRFLSQKPEDA